MGFKNVVGILNDIQIFLWNFGDIIWELFQKNFIVLLRNQYFFIYYHFIFRYIFERNLVRFGSGTLRLN